MRRLAGLARLAVGRSVAAPGLFAIRFFGVLVAVTLVAGVALYSTAMGDAMLRASLSRDGSSTELTFSNIQQPLSPATYHALDRYIRRQAGRDLGLPLSGLHVHHYTSTLPVYRVGTAPNSPLVVREDELEAVLAAATRVEDPQAA